MFESAKAGTNPTSCMQRVAAARRIGDRSEICKLRSYAREDRVLPASFCPAVQDRRSAPQVHDVSP